MVTGERGDGTLTRHGLEEYVSDCVILLDHRVRTISHPAPAHRQIPGLHPRHERVPFLITEQGISVLPVTSVGLEYP